MKIGTFQYHNKNNDRFLAKLALVFFSFLALFYLLTTNGTVDEADSVSHFLYSKYALKYTWFFVHLWAKPIFVTFSFPFAQFGFTGIQIYNLLIAMIAAWYAFLIAENFKLPRPYLTIIILLCMPQYWLTCFSGLTEPTFSLMTIMAIYYAVKEKYALASIIAGFSPFARPEGMFLIGLFILFLLMKRRSFKYIPLLFVGHIFYTLIGAIVFDDDWLWVFLKNPNAVLTPSYGRTGDYLHYIKGLLYVVGIPIFIFFGLGMLNLIFQLLRKKLNHKLEYALLVGMIAAVIVMHTIFWKFGLFKSLGLLRNLLTIAPLVAIIALVGFNWIINLNKLSNQVKNYFAYVFIVLILIFPYLDTEYGFRYPDNFNLNNVQVMANAAADYIKNNHQDAMLYDYQPQISLHLDIDYFDWRIRQTLNKDNFEAGFKNNSIIVWDDWLAVMEGGVTLEMMQNRPDLVEVKRFQSKDPWGYERIMVVFWKEK